MLCDDLEGWDEGMGGRLKGEQIYVQQRLTTLESNYSPILKFLIFFFNF